MAASQDTTGRFGQYTIVGYDELYDVPDDFEKVDKFRELQVEIQVAFGKESYDEQVEAMSHILKDHINTDGNHKIADNTAIFNMNSATDCPNRESENCQVPWESCYAGKAERQYGAPLDYRRRQQYLWDCLTADMFVDSFKAMVSRKRKPIEYLRLSEAGDFRTEGDIVKAEHIAKRLKKEINVQTYTYSASDYLQSWDNVEWLTVNQSNDRRDYGNRHYTAIPEGVDPEDVDFLDDNAVQCPNDLGTDRKCGECTICIEKDAPDAYVRLH